MTDRVPIHRLVLTGGPCGGKSTALARVTERLQGLGFDVYRVPEAATILIGGGLNVVGVSPARLVEAQEAILRVVMALEDAFTAVARDAGRPAVLLCDRGTMDSAGYLPPESWQALLDGNDWSVVGLRDRRYDAVFHLVTAADGAEAFYTTANNAARSESPELARLVDGRLRDAWVGHPRLRVIDNGTDFDGKMLRLLRAVCNVVGKPEPREVERRFLVRTGGAAPPVRSEEFDIEQTYLAGPDGEEVRVRRRGQNNAWTYTFTSKRPAPDGGRVMSERPITGREYLALLGQADPARRPVRKRRRVFLWQNHYFELDTFVEPRPGLEILEVELDAPDSPVTLPPFVEVVREVTGDAGYGNHALALRDES